MNTLSAGLFPRLLCPCVSQSLRCVVDATLPHSSSARSGWSAWTGPSLTRPASRTCSPWPSTPGVSEAAPTTRTSTSTCVVPVRNRFHHHFVVHLCVADLLSSLQVTTCVTGWTWRSEGWASTHRTSGECPKSTPTTSKMCLYAHSQQLSSVHLSKSYSLALVQFKSSTSPN